VVADELDYVALGELVRSRREEPDAERCHWQEVLATQLLQGWLLNLRYINSYNKFNKKKLLFSLSTTTLTKSVHTWNTLYLFSTFFFKNAVSLISSVIVRRHLFLLIRSLPKQYHTFKLHEIIKHFVNLIDAHTYQCTKLLDLTMRWIYSTHRVIAYFMTSTSK